LELRKESDEAEELERLEPRAAKLRKQLADAQIVASRDPASTSFELLIGTLLAKAGVKEIDGTVGFPALMILLMELVSALGLYIIGEISAGPISLPRGTGFMKTRHKKRLRHKVSSTVNGTVPPRLTLNRDRRPREYLTPKEVERLMGHARKRGATVCAMRR
jgi:hypothetical protein